MATYSEINTGYCIERWKNLGMGMVMAAIQVRMTVAWKIPESYEPTAEPERRETEDEAEKECVEVAGGHSFKGFLPVYFTLTPVVRVEEEDFQRDGKIGMLLARIKKLMHNKEQIERPAPPRWFYRREYHLTRNLLTTTRVAPHSKVSEGQMGFNSALKGLKLLRWLLPFIVVLFMMVSSAVADIGAVCPTRCRCTVQDSYFNSSSVKCSSLGLSDIPTMLYATTLHTLDLSYNRISILRNTSFSNYSRLSTLALSYNEIKEIEVNTFAGLRMMRNIDLQYNNLESFNPEIFSTNTVLENVSLRGNPIAFLPSDSPILISASVSILDLNHCSLTSVNPITFSRLPSLYSLDLSSNLLQTISVTAFEKLPKLRILKLNNNRWTCDCSTLEVMQWLTLRREQAPAHKPVKCLERQTYRKFWTEAGGSQPCWLSTTTEALVRRDGEFTTDMTVDLTTVSVGISQSLKLIPHKTSQPDEEMTVTTEAKLHHPTESATGGREGVFTTDMAVDLPIISVGIAPPLKASLGTTSQRVIKNAVTRETERRPASESETVGWASLLSWNVTTMMVFVILPITLGIAVFVSLIAVNYIVKRGKGHRTQHDIQEKYNHFAAFFSKVPLLKTQLTADITKQHAGYEKRSSYGVGGTEYHVYERID